MHFQDILITNVFWIGRGIGSLVLPFVDALSLPMIGTAAHHGLNRLLDLSFLMTQLLLELETRVVFLGN